MDAKKNRFMNRPYEAQPWPLLFQQIIKHSSFQRIKVAKHLVVAKLLAFLVLVLSGFPMKAVCVSYVDHIDADFSASAMSYVDNDGVFLYSLSSSFAVALHAFTGKLAVYLTVIHISSHQIVWTANRDTPASPSDKLNFLPSGNVVLMHGNGSNVFWSTKTRGATKMQIQDTGNLVLLDALNNTIWQSFDYPTDTLLTGQVLRMQAGMKLVSGKSEIDASSGPYSLSLESGDLHLVFSSNSNMALPYWSMSMDARLVNSATGAPSYAVLNNTGLSLLTNNSRIISLLSWSSNATLCRATLETDGNLHIYVFSSNVWTLQFVALKSNCELPMYCGPLGLCNNEHCSSCPGTLQPVNKNMITQGCQGTPKFPCSKGSSMPSSTTHFEKVADGLEYFANQYVFPVWTTGLHACQALCANDCNCSSLFFHNETGFCYLYPELGTVQSTNNSNHALYVRTLAPAEAPGVDAEDQSQHTQELPLFAVLAIAGSSLFIIFAMIAIFIYWHLKVRRHVNYSGGDGADEDDFLDSIPGPRRFSFKELQVATNDFATKLGTGGFGSVYEGVLPDQTKVAVKKLESVGQGKKEFQAEVGIIGSIHHFHLVQLRGFCAEGAHKLLVYEYMSNGSLHKCLFAEEENNQVLDWNTRYKIALGTARGLAYLHSDCIKTILHCDIKPENILLDENFNAKVSDFGLAKLLNKEQSQVFTTMRGTRGYLAPEWLLNVAISDKSDVYSFGMVLLEIISGRKNYEPSEISEKCYLPAFAFAQAEQGHLEQLVDGRLRGSVSDDKIIEVVRIALWCIQEDTLSRPSMARVVQMLEGNVRVGELPSSSQLAVRLHARMVEAFSGSQKSSSGALDNHSRSLLSSVQISAPR